MTADLASRMDVLNDTIARIEDALTRDHCVRAEVPIPGGGHLAFGKLGGTWRLTYVSADNEEGPLQNASMKVRMEAVYHLDDLEAALVAERDRLAGEARIAVAVAEKWLAKRGGDDA